jgi:hypothetical protein
VSEYPDLNLLFSCDCGSMHLVSPETALCISALGPTVTMVTGHGACEMPRVYAEVHQPGTEEIPLLAAVHSWELWDPE